MARCCCWPFRYICDALLSRMQLFLLLLFVTFALTSGTAPTGLPTGSPTGYPSSAPTPSPSVPTPRPTQAWEEWVRTSDRPSPFPTPIPSAFPTVAPTASPTQTSEPTGVWLAPPPTGGTPFSATYSRQSAVVKVSILCGFFFVPLIGVGLWVLARRCVTSGVRFSRTTTGGLYDTPDTEHVGSHNPLVPGSDHSDAGMLAASTPHDGGDPSSYSLKRPTFYVV